MFRIRATKPNLALLRQDGRAFVRAQFKAAHRAVDRASQVGHRRVRMAMKMAGLGKLDRVVAHSSSLKKQRTNSRHPWGLVYARGQNRPDSRGAGALEIYSEGGVIAPKNTLFGTGWLWIPTNRIPKRIRGYKPTPALYNRSPLVSSIGPLVYKRIASHRAILTVRRVTVSPKTGRAKAAGKRRPRTRIAMPEIVAFVGIRITRRAKRFDQHAIMRAAGRLVPRYMNEELLIALSRGR